MTLKEEDEGASMVGPEPFGGLEDERNNPLSKSPIDLAFDTFEEVWVVSLKYLKAPKKTEFHVVYFGLKSLAFFLWVDLSACIEKNE